MTNSNDPDQIRAEIDRTRLDLSRNVDALTERARPTNMARRQGRRLGDSVRDLGARIMGSDDEGYDGPYDEFQYGRQSRLDAAGDRVGELRDEAGQRLSDAQEYMQDAPRMARRRTQGNPLAAGLIALGAGWLVGSVLPSSQREQQASVALKEKAAPVMEHAQGLAKEMGDNLREPVQAAVADVKEAATEAAQNVKAEGQTSVENVKGEGQAVAADVKDSAVDAKDTVQEKRDK